MFKKALKEPEEVRVENGFLDLGIKRFSKRLKKSRFSSDKSEKHHRVRLWLGGDEDGTKGRPDLEHCPHSSPKKQPQGAGICLMLVVLLLLGSLKVVSSGKKRTFLGLGYYLHRELEEKRRRQGDQLCR